MRTTLTVLIILVAVLISGHVLSRCPRLPGRLSDQTASFRVRLGWAAGAIERRDIFAALALYDQVSSEAAATGDWQALLAVACGLEKLGRLRGLGLSAETILKQAAAVAGQRRSAVGIHCAQEGLRKLGRSALGPPIRSRENSNDQNHPEICNFCDLSGSHIAADHDRR